MAVDKLVDSTELDTNLLAVANAIRTKGGTSGALQFPSEFIEAINNISGGGTNVKHFSGTVTLNSSGAAYAVVDFQPDVIIILGGEQYGYQWQAGGSFADISASGISNIETSIYDPSESAFIFIYLFREADGFRVSMTKNGDPYAGKTVSFAAIKYTSGEETILTLFNAETGGDNTEVTGGWYKTTSGGSVTVNENQISATSSTSDSVAILSTRNKINLTGFTKLKITGHTTKSTGKYLIHTVNSIIPSKATISVAAPNGTQDELKEIDISSLNGEYYVMLYATYYSGTDITSATKITLER